ncbi:heme-binding protein [uncultured Friedmanniella sp.]|uniref:GlcG/HbpS family heme-binding protein n=1 Tax=uncultured Friedmanniella sp. TaxID=335381 RepID=UPI0035CC074C
MTSTVSTPDMTLALAEQVLTGLKAEAAAVEVALAVAVLDRGGNLVAALRMDGAQLGASSLALDKAYTAVAFGLPTGAWVASSTPGASDWGLASTLDGRAVVFPGGVPVFLDGHLIGGVGVSGAKSVVDEACAEKAVLSAGLATVR